MYPKILVSAGEASGDFYAALVVEELRRSWPSAVFFGCTGPRLRAAGVREIVDAHSLAVVGLLEVVSHIPRIYGEYRKLLAAVEREKPDVAVLTDAPDFHLRLARRLRQKGIRVVYLVAPQVWAWRLGRLAGMRRNINHLLCIFPFEEEFFARHGLPATYIGHPLAGLVKPTTSRPEFFRKHNLAPSRPLIAVLPGSRRGEAGRHLPALLDAVRRLNRERAAQFVLPAAPIAGASFFRERIGQAPIQVLEGESWDALAHADVALAASGTVTVEAALLGTPMVTFYKVTPPSWVAGKLLVRVPFYSMVNLIAGRLVVPELMQREMTGANVASAAERLLTNENARAEMRTGLDEVRRRLSGEGKAARCAAAVVREILEGRTAHVV
jgi:lipid-A-disaccharide synthase